MWRTFYAPLPGRNAIKEIPFVLIKCAETLLAIPAQFVDRILDQEEATGLAEVGYQMYSLCQSLGMKTDKLTQALVPTYHGNQLWMVSAVVGVNSYPLASLYPIPPVMQPLRNRFGLEGWLMTRETLIPVIAMRAGRTTA